LDREVAGCPQDETEGSFIATGSATRGGEQADDVEVTVTGPDGSTAVDSGMAILDYAIREADCGEEGILFVAAGAGKKAEAKADVVEVKFESMGDPHRIGITKSIDRTQHLQATVSPKKYTNDVELSVDTTKLKLSNAQKDPDTGVIKFDLVGTHQSTEKGDAWVKATVNGVPGAEFTRKVSVVVPAKVWSNHEAGRGEFKPVLSRPALLNAGTSPPAPEGGPPIPNTEGWESVVAMADTTVFVVDQFDHGIGAIYLGANISESGPGGTINQTLQANSGYTDKIGRLDIAPPPTHVTLGSAAAAAWLANTPQPLATGPWSDGDVDVWVDGFKLNPGVVNRKTRSVAPDIIEIDWPDGP
jgi:hypothetical protein